MEKQTNSIESSLQLLKNSYQKMKSEFQNLNEEKCSLQSLIKYHTNRSEENCRTQKDHYEIIIKDLNKLVESLQARVKDQELQENEKSRKEIRKYVQAINQKEVQINSLKRQIATLKTKIVSQQQEINNMNNTKQNFQIFVFKGIDQIKLHIKQTNAELQDLQTEKMVLVSKLRQHTQKFILAENQVYGLESKKNILQQNYQNLKVLHKKSREQYIDLKFEISRLKQSNLLSIDNPNTLGVPKEQSLDLNQQLHRVTEVNQVLDKCESLLRQTNQFSQINKQLIEENNLLKAKFTNYEYQIDEIKCKYESGYEDEYLKKKQPSVYDYLLQKKKKFQQFQQTIQKIQNYIETKDCDINQILSLMMNKETKCICGKDGQLSELKKQFQALNFKIESWTDVIQKCKKQKIQMEQKIDIYRGQIRNITNNKGMKGKKKPIRCSCCMLPILKNQKSEVCQDCKKNLHTENCSLEHNCGSFVFQDSISVAQSNFFA